MHTGAPSVYNSYNRSQTPGGVNLLPKLRDQGLCSTCVGHAVAAAVEAAIASTLQQDASSFDISAGSLYYCSEGGRTCATGWTLICRTRGGNDAVRVSLNVMGRQLA